ncbi:hypothetical protein GCM10026983_39410 [Gracilibacillus alcaliphilus]
MGVFMNRYDILKVTSKKEGFGDWYSGCGCCYGFVLGAVQFGMTSVIIAET